MTLSVEGSDKGNNVRARAWARPGDAGEVSKTGGGIDGVEWARWSCPKAPGRRGDEGLRAGPGYQREEEQRGGVARAGAGLSGWVRSQRFGLGRTRVGSS